MSEATGGTGRWATNPWVLGPALMALAAVIATGAYLLTFSHLHPEFKPYQATSDVDAKIIPGSRFEVARGSGETSTGNSRTITRYLRGEAVFRTRALVDTAAYPFLRVKVSGLNPDLKFFVFWRTAERPDGIYHAELHFAGDGSYTYNMLRAGVWEGRLIDVSIGAFGPSRGQPFTLEEVAFLPYSATGVLATIWTEWISFRPWSLPSINKYIAVPAGSLLRPSVANNAWFFTALACLLLFAFFLRWRGVNARPALPLTVGIMFAISWTAQDLLFMGFRAQQAQETIRTFAGKTLPERAASSPMRCAAMRSIFRDDCRTDPPLPYF